MNIRQLSSTLFAAFAALPVSGQARPPGGDDYVGLGLSKSYSCRVTERRNVLESSLCPDRTKAKVKGDSSGYLISCAPTGPSKSIAEVIKSIALLGFDDDHETAEAWARVAPTSQGSQITLGVILKRNKARVTTARGHFFKPDPWGQSLWHDLDRRAKNCGGI